MNVAQNRRSENFRPIEEICAEAIDKIEKVNQADNPITGMKLVLLILIERQQAYSHQI